MKEFDELVEVIAKLRAPGGCAWDREQDHDTLIPYLLEETYEVMDNLINKDYNSLKEELGDLLLQILLHAQLEDEKNNYSIRNVVESITEKLIRRHPHVFGDVETDDSNVIRRNWEKIKQEERKLKNKPERKSILDGVPKSMPSLTRAYKVQDKAARVGFQWDDYKGALAKFHEELAELEESLENGTRDEIEDEFGDVLFCVVNIARYFSIDPETALHRVISKFYRRFGYIEKKLKDHGMDITSATLQDMDSLWDEYKAKCEK